MTGFADYLARVAKRFPSQRALADAIGITPQRLSRALDVDGEYTLNTENCLRLAKIADVPAVEVLRAAGKGEVAELLEHLFPKAGRPAVTGAERELLDKWAALPPSVQQNFKVLIDIAAAAATPGKKQKLA